MNRKRLVVFMATFFFLTTIVSAGFLGTPIYAENNNDHHDNDDKVKLDCLDAALVLVTLDFALDLGGEDLKGSISGTLEEAEIAPDLQSIVSNFEDALDDVEDKCEADNVQDILDFIDFSD
jgi:hypothetical protein